MHPFEIVIDASVREIFAFGAAERSRSLISDVRIVTVAIAIASAVLMIFSRSWVVRALLLASVLLDLYFAMRCEGFSAPEFSRAVDQVQWPHPVAVARLARLQPWLFSGERAISASELGFALEVKRSPTFGMLQVTAAIGRVDLGRLLLRAGAPVKKPPLSPLPIDTAAMNDDVEFMGMLLDAGATPSEKHMGSYAVMDADRRRNRSRPMVRAYGMRGLGNISMQAGRAAVNDGVMDEALPFKALAVSQSALRRVLEFGCDANASRNGLTLVQTALVGGFVR
jgi:hypothetical protein